MVFMAHTSKKWGIFEKRVEPNLGDFEAESFRGSGSPKPFFNPSLGKGRMGSPAVISCVG
jgi:hypothetical protein